MNGFNRTLVLIGAALALPIIVLVVLQVAFSLSREREDVERAALARAEQVNMLADARVEADLAALAVLATSSSFEQRDWPSAYQRARVVASFNPHWRSVIVSDLTSGVEIFNLQRPYSNARPPINPLFRSNNVRGINGVVREGLGCPCVYVHMREPNDPRFLVTVALDTSAFQSILMSRLPQGAVAAVVDREGRFIARSVEYEARVGAPATEYVRNAIAGRERSGIYPGKTYEGFENFTAYETSNLTGWSTHIAVASALVNRPRAFSYLAIAVGALIALALAAGLIVYALHDLAQRKRGEERIAQAQKLEAIGQLTGGVAHDFNNLLTVIIGGLGMLLRRLEDPQQRWIAENMLDAAKRGDKLTKQLLAFSRGRRLELTPVDLHALVRGMEELLRRSIEPGVTLSFNLDDDARWAISDSNQLELAILNLAINARDAMPNGGHVEIGVHAARKKPECLELVVSDNGIGMPRDVVERAIEPFFTTKPAGKGTGLGLAQVYGAIRQSGGTMEIDSAPDHGTTIRLFLVRCDPPAQIEPKAADDTRALDSIPAAAGRTVLVVDDEPGVRAFMAETLREAGYNATEAEDAGIALARLETDPPDLLLTDFSMPGMNGLELAERARARTPGLKVLIVSGYADAATLEKSAAQPQLLRKPFDERALVDAVEGALGK